MSKVLGGVATSVFRAFVSLAYVFVFSPVTKAVDSPVHTTPSGTFIRYGKQTVFIEGIQLPRQVVSTLIQAGVSAILAPLTHYAMLYGMARAEKALSETNYQWLLGRIDDGTLLIPVYLFRIINTVRRLLSASFPLREEIGSRLYTLMGSKTGRIPFYPGKHLDQSVFIDVVRKPAAFPYIEITPLAFPPERQAFTVWEQALADFTGQLLDHNIVALHVVDEKKESELLLRWYQGQGGDAHWRQHSLLTRNDDSQDFEDSRLLPVLTPHSLQCIADIVTDQSTDCGVDQSLSYVQRKPVHFAPVNGEVSMGFLRVSDNTSWSPGLPGELSLVSSLHEGRVSETLGQFRLPYWSALILDALLHEVAIGAAQGIVNSGVNLWNRVRHNSHQYESVAVLKTIERSTGEVIPVVERVSDKSGKYWIRKVSPWGNLDKRNPEGFLHLVEEAHILSRLDHENIVKYHDSWLENSGSSAARFVMIVEDGGLDLNSFPPQSLKGFRGVMRGALKGLESAHNAGIGHFDISAGNVVRGLNGVTKLADFGAARHLDKHNMAFPQLCTDIYNAPERQNRRLMSANVDIWALGVLGVLGLESIRVPGAAAASAALQNLDNPRRSFSLSSYLDKTTDYFDFLNQMLTKNREERPSAGEMLKHPFLKNS